MPVSINHKTARTRKDTVVSLAQSAVAVPLTGTTSKTAMATITLPGGLVGANGSVRITTLWSVTNSANNKVITVELDGSSIGSSTLTTTATYRDQRQFSNRNSQASQVSFTGIFGGFGSSSIAVTTLTKDTSLDKDIVIYGTLANSGETMTLESYVVEVLPRD